MGFRFSVMLVAALVLTSTTAIADDWQGYYRGIDAGDGSSDQMSIVATGEESYAISIRSDRYGLCHTEHGHNAGTITAKGRIHDGKLVRHDSMLRCDHAGEARPVADMVYTMTGALLSTQASNDGRAIYYHRISQ